MKIKIVAKNIELTQGLREAVEKKLSKLEKYFGPEIVAHVTLSVQKKRQIVEVTIPFNGVVLRGQEDLEDMYASIDLVIDKLEGQIRKQKTKLQRRQVGDSLRYQYIDDVKEDTNEPKIVKTKRFSIKPMSTDEAILQMELIGHNFFVFEDSDNNSICVVYKRKDGNYGLIDPEY